MGESARDKGVKNYMGDLSSFNNDIKKTDFSANNRFNGYKPQFGYNEMKTGLDNQLKTDTNLLKNDFNDSRLNYQKDAAERMASQGITGGSVYNNNVAAAGNAAGKNYSSALGQMLSNRANANAGLMDSANRSQFNITQAVSEMDLQNIGNLLRKYGLMNTTLGQQGQATQMLSDDTWFDSVLGVVNTAAPSVIKALL